MLKMWGIDDPNVVFTFEHIVFTFVIQVICTFIAWDMKPVKHSKAHIKREDHENLKTACKEKLHANQKNTVCELYIQNYEKSRKSLVILQLNAFLSTVHCTICICVCEREVI